MIEPSLADAGDPLAHAAAAGGFSLWRCDAAGSLHCDGELRGQLGYPSAPLGDVESLLGLMHADSRDRVRAALRRAQARGDSFSTDFWADHASGATLGFRMRGRVVAGDGAPMLAGAIWEDTESLRLHEQLAEKTRLLEQQLFAFRSARVAAWTLHLDASGQDGRLEGDGLAASVMGLSTPRLDQPLSSWLQLLHADDRERVTTQLQLALGAQDSFSLDYRVIAQDGQLHGIRSVGRVYRDGQGRALHASGASFDVTAEQHALERLESSNRALDDFAYIASHDLKEPLRGIHNYSRFLLEDYGDRLDEQGLGMLKTLGRLAQRLEALTTDLLSYSRLGRLELATGLVDLDQTVDEVLESLQFSLRERQVEIRRPRPLPRLRGDRVRIAELFRNLISNALKYNDKPTPWIEVGYRAGPPLQLYVSDNGIGIARNHHDRIFQIFKRLHERDAYGGGTGAGLAIARKIVEMHHGHIHVESEPGQGATFIFDLLDAPR